MADQSLMLLSERGEHNTLVVRKCKFVFAKDAHLNTDRSLRVDGGVGVEVQLWYCLLLSRAVQAKDVRLLQLIGVLLVGLRCEVQEGERCRMAAVMGEKMSDAPAY